MSHDELLQALFPDAAPMVPDTQGVIEGEQRLAGGAALTVIGLTGARPVGADLALAVSAAVLRHAAAHAGRPSSCLSTLEASGWPGATNCWG